MISRPTTLSALLMAGLVSPAFSQTTQYTALGFEAPTFVPGALADDTLNQFGGTGQDDWIATASLADDIDFSRIFVQNQTVWSGSQAATIQAEGQSFGFMHLRRNTQFSMTDPSEPILDVRMRMKLDSSSNPSDAWGFQAQAGPGPGSGIFRWDIHPDNRIRYVDVSQGVEVDTGFTLSRDVWHEVITSIDYIGQEITITVDGMQVAQFDADTGAQFGFFAFASIALFEPGNDQMHFDDFELVSHDGSGFGTLFCDPANPNSTGQSTVLSGSMGSGTGSGLHLEATQGPPTQLGYFLVGSGVSDPGIVLSQGRLCLSIGGGNQIGRYNAVGGHLNSVGMFNANGLLENLVGTSLTGTGFDVPVTLPITGSPQIAAGQTWHFQLWHRESGGAANFSNGLSVTF